MNTQIAEVGQLDTLYDASRGTQLPLPDELARFYGPLCLPQQSGGGPYVIANMVTSLDGVVSLGIPGQAGGKEISGANQQDRALMGLLRAVADAVVVGAGTLREGRGEPLTAQAIYPPMASAYARLRANLNKAEEPLAVVVTASGDLDPSLRVFNGTPPALVVTTSKGAEKARDSGLINRATVAAVEAEGEAAPDSITAGAVLDAIKAHKDCHVVLVEGGPHLLGDFFAGGLIDEQFLTLSPQLVGRDKSGQRLGLVEGTTFAPGHPLWGVLSVVKRGESHLFLRYLLSRAKAGE